MSDDTPLPTTGDLVFVTDTGEPATTSLTVAAETGNQHQNVRELIEENLDDLNDVGVVRFETGKPATSTNGGGRPTKYAILDEPAAALLLTYLRNTPKIKGFKKRLVAGFYAMRRALTEQQQPKTAAELILAQSQVLVAQEQRLNAVETQQAQLAQRIDAILPDQHEEIYYSGRGWARIRNIDANLTYVQRLGAKAGVIGRAAGLEADRVPDPRWGLVNGWPLWVWDAAHDQIQNPAVAR